jgi:hypothetical protein
LDSHLKKFIRLILAFGDFNKMVDDRFENNFEKNG